MNATPVIIAVKVESDVYLHLFNDRNAANLHVKQLLIEECKAGHTYVDDADQAPARAQELYDDFVKDGATSMNDDYSIFLPDVQDHREPAPYNPDARPEWVYNDAIQTENGVMPRVMELTEDGENTHIAVVDTTEHAQLIVRSVNAAPKLAGALSAMLDAASVLADNAGDVPEWNEGGIAHEACNTARVALTEWSKS